jgi:hypothetical protein
MKPSAFKVLSAVLVASVNALSSLPLLKVLSNYYGFDISSALMSAQ